MSERITREEWQMNALASADDDGKLEFIQIDFFTAISWIVDMVLKGWVTRKDKHNETGPWYITEAGRRAQEPEG